MAFDVDVLTRLEGELNKAHTKRKSLDGIAKTMGRIEQPFPPSLRRAFRDFYSELQRGPALRDWLTKKTEAERLNWERENSEQRAAWKRGEALSKQHAKANALTVDADVHQLLAEKGVRTTRVVFGCLKQLSDDAIAGRGELPDRGQLTMALEALAQLRDEANAMQRRDELANVVHVALEANANRRQRRRTGSAEAKRIARRKEKERQRKEDAKLADEWLRGHKSGRFVEYADMPRPKGLELWDLKASLERDRKQRPDAWAAMKKPRRTKSVKTC